jgi:hypothetical protein
MFPFLLLVLDPPRSTPALRISFGLLTPFCLSLCWISHPPLVLLVTPGSRSGRGVTSKTGGVQGQAQRLSSPDSASAPSRGGQGLGPWRMPAPESQCSPARETHRARTRGRGVVFARVILPEEPFARVSAATRDARGLKVEQGCETSYPRAIRTSSLRQPYPSMPPTV